VTSRQPFLSEVTGNKPPAPTRIFRLSLTLTLTRNKIISFKTRLRSPSPNAVSLTSSSASSSQEGRTLLLSFPRSGSTSCSTYRSTHPRRQRFQAPFKSDLLHARKYRISRKGELPCLKETRCSPSFVRRSLEQRQFPGDRRTFYPNYAHHDSSTPDLGRGPESEKKRATLYRTAFPDLRLTVEDIIAEGETVVARWSCRGTHKGDLNGIAPTGKQFNVTGVSIARFTNGKMSEGFVNWDALSLMQQLGVVLELAKSKAVAATR